MSHHCRTLRPWRVDGETRAWLERVSCLHQETQIILLRGIEDPASQSVLNETEFPDWCACPSWK